MKCIQQKHVKTGTGLQECSNEKIDKSKRIISFNL